MPKPPPIFEPKTRVRRQSSLLWVFDRFEFDPGYLRSRMFGCETAYMDGMLCLGVIDRGDEPWNGLLVCTSRERQAGLMAEMPALRPHKVLGKWLYISQNDPAFEESAARLVEWVLARDSRIGVEPKRA
ncbi:hypothetical protein ACFO0J_10070 [Castellaniella hirudinis]|uniref:TfoX N-terminal domain-containing protein n=1 Tax=Castellaniella hirudinis TaxID=1144617 RepID=A0ABV8RZQ3_9BURK